MIIIQKASSLTAYLEKQRGAGLTIGFVPTMGALHDAHIHLVEQSASVCDLTVCSIFVNPTQFNDPADYDKYPVTIESDIMKLARSRASVLFIPSVNDIYPAGTAQLERYDLGYLETILEGAFRPGHFQGVCQVMSRLLKLVQPGWVFMGQKDYQQCMVIKRLLLLMGMQTMLVTCPTVRAQDGLAMSSRNVRLTNEQRAMAPAIYQALQEIKMNLTPGNLKHLKDHAVLALTSAGFNVEYLEIADAGTLQTYDEWDGHTPLVAVTAAFAGDVRLIDNLLLNN